MLNDMVFVKNCELCSFTMKMCARGRKSKLAAKMKEMAQPMCKKLKLLFEFLQKGRTRQLQEVNICLVTRHNVSDSIAKWA